MQLALDVVARWARAFGMEFNVAKCGLMCVHVKAVDDIARGIINACVERVGITLQGQRVPVVDSYVYLGSRA